MYRINRNCRGCGLCIQYCPTGAISLINKKAFIDVSRCIKCGTCSSVCPLGAIEFASYSEIDDLKERIQNLKHKINRLNKKINELASRK